MSTLTIDKNVLPNIHKLPHLLVNRNLRALSKQINKLVYKKSSFSAKLTLKNSIEEESFKTPYSTSVCLANSSAEFIGATIRSTYVSKKF